MTYDAVVILGGGLRREGDIFSPATYADSDEFGMLGGHMRVIAGVELLRRAESDTFVFTTGIYEKNKARLGPDVLPEADVYAAHFLEQMASMNLSRPQIVLESASKTTLENMSELVRIIEAQGWKRVAIVSNTYHLPRIEALYEHLFKLRPDLHVDIAFLSAEEIVRSVLPGRYDEEIEAAYASPAAVKRAESEARGLRDLENGTYALEEFQLIRQFF